MVTASDLEKWQKSIQGIEAGQNNLSPEELSAFNSLKELFIAGNFESGESSGNIKLIKDAVPRHSAQRLLQLHLKNFITLCEQNFTNKNTATFVQPPPPVTQHKAAEGKKDNKSAKKSNKQLILTILTVAILIGAWNVYRHWDTVRNWEPISKWFVNKPTPVIPVASNPLVVIGAWNGTLNDEPATFQFLSVDTASRKVLAKIYFPESRNDTLKLSGTIDGYFIELKNDSMKYSGVLKPDSSVYSGTFYNENTGTLSNFSFKNPKIAIDTLSEKIEQSDTALVAGSGVYTITSIPKESYVTNPDGIISQAAKDRLNAMIVSVEKATTDEIAVVLLSSIGNEEINDFGTRLANYWGVGKKNINNGLLFLLVKDKKQMTFRTGYGLENVLPDTFLLQVIRNDISPLLSKDDFDGGIIAGMSKICDYLKKPENVRKVMQSGKDLNIQKPVTTQEKEQISSSKSNQNLTTQPQYVDNFPYTNGAYTGMMLNGKRQGKGVYMWNNGDSFDGYYENDKMSGYGRLDSKSKMFRYEGNFANGEFNGQGIYYDDRDGWRHEGNFKDGKPDGEGTRYYNKGKNIKGIWENGELISTAK